MLSDTKHKVIIIFYSRTGKTRTIAATLRDTFGFHFQEVIDLKDRSGFIGYIGSLIDIFFRPITEIVPKETNFDNYDFLIIGSPIWGNRLPPAITTFFSTARFFGKKIILFINFGSHMKASLFDKYTKLINNCGGEVIGTLKIKTRGKLVDAIRNETKQIMQENIERWNSQI